MNALKIFFWISLFIIFYSYIGYGILLWIIIKIRRVLGWSKTYTGNEDYEPEVTLFVSAFNEKEYLHQKVVNSKSLNYPKNKVHQLWVLMGQMMALQSCFAIKMV